MSTEEITVKINIIDIIRILSTFFVFNLHVAEQSNQLVPIWSYSRFTIIFKTPAWAAVWIFFILSGYTNALGFTNGKYELNFKGITEFYKKRILKTYIPTMCFFVAMTILVQPQFIVNNSVSVWFRLMLCTYNGDPGGNGIGSTWFVFSLMWLYMLMPIIYYVIKKLSRIVSPTVLIFVTIFAGAVLRMMMLSSGADWYTSVYTPFYMNLDLFCVGVIMTQINNKLVNTKVNRDVIIVSLSIVILFSNMYLYYIGCGWSYALYRYLYPSVYCILICIVLYNYRNLKIICYNNQKKLKKVTIYITNFFARISFEFYLFHSIIMSRIVTVFKCEKNPILNYYKLLLYVGVVTLIFAYGFSRVFRVNNNTAQHEK